jgi:hypothetical protein
MTAKKSEKNTLVVLNLDRPRFLKYGHKALKKLQGITGKNLANLNPEDFTMEELEKVIYCGLLSDAKEHNETLKLEDMEDILDEAPSFAHVLEGMNKAFDLAFEHTEKQKN